MNPIFAIRVTINGPSGQDGSRDLQKCPRTHRGIYPRQHRDLISAKNAVAFAEAWRAFQ